MKKPEKLTYSEYNEKISQIATPIGLYLVPTNLAEEREKFLNSETYNPHFTYRKANKRKNFEILDELSDLQEITNVDPELSKYFIDVIAAKKQASELLEAIGDDEKFAKISKERFGFPSDKLYSRVCKILRGRYGSIEVVNRDTKMKERELGFDDIVAIFTKVFSVLGLDDWTIEGSKAIAASEFRTTAKTKRIMIDPGIETNAERIKKTIVHEVMTHAVRSENGYSTGFDTFGKPNLIEYLDAEEGLALYNEELYGVLRNIDIKRKAAQTYAVYLSETMSFREVFKAMNAVYPKRNAFATVLRVKRGMSETSRPGGYYKDVSYLRGFLKVRKFLKDNEVGYRNLYAGKIGLDHLYLVEEGILPKPQIVPSKEAVKSMFKQVGL
ncbi:MAG: tyrosine/phenylalanine carboxypeptidase domain-containing protein [bacterium]